jgi:hypothetical protein
MNKLEEKAKKYVDEMKKQGYVISEDFAMNLVSLKEKNPTMPTKELIEQTFKKTLAFYDEFEKNPKPYINEIHRQLNNEQNENKNSTKPFKIKEKSDLHSKERNR